MILLYTLFFLAATIFLFRSLKKMTKMESHPPDNRIAGPTPWPIFGNGAIFDKPSVHLVLYKIFQKFGSVYKLRVKNKYWVVVGDGAVIREALVKRGPDFAERLPVFSEASGPQFNNFKNMVHHAIFRKIAILLSGSYDDNVENKNATEMFIEELASRRGESFNPHTEVDCFNSRILASLLMGKHGVDQTKNISRLAFLINTKFLPDTTWEIDEIFPWVKYFTHSGQNEGDKIRDLVNTIYEDRKGGVLAGVEDDRDKGILHLLFLEAKKNDQAIHDDFMKLLIAMLAGGADTTSGFLCTTLAVLAHYPHMQKAIHREVSSVAGDELPQLQHLGSCPYTMALILEVMRNTSTAFLQTSHRAVKDSTLAGYDIPKGTAIMLHTWAANHDPKVWVDPFRYKPERFLDDAGNLLPTDHPTRRQFLPFNAGNMMCPGRDFATARLFLGTATVVQKFIVEPEHQINEELTDPRVLNLKHNIELRFCRRD